MSVWSNTTLMVLKFIVGIFVGSVSLVSEALHSGIDLLAAMIALWTVKHSDLPPDEEHDYGHGKFENISSAIEALLIVGAALGIIYEAIERWDAGASQQHLGYGVLIMAVSVAVNYYVSERLMKVAKQTGSQALEADALHLRADIWTSVGVLVGLALIWQTGWFWLDPVIAIGVAAIIFKAGWGMVVESTLELTDASLPPEEEERLGEIIDAHDEVLGYHCMRTRKSGAFHMLDVHILFHGDMTLSDVHKICDAIEDEIHEEFGAFDVLIHPEPFEDAEDESKASHFIKSKLQE